MKNKIVLNLSGVSGKARQWIAAQVKNNLRALGFNVDNSADADNSHMGFSIAANGGQLTVNFDFNNENQATRHILDGSHVYNEHQLTEFFAAAKELADAAKRGAVPQNEREDRIVEREIEGIKVAMCKHGAGLVMNRETALRLLLEPDLFPRIVRESRQIAQSEGLIPAGA
jgi:hypothetical protein